MISLLCSLVFLVLLAIAPAAQAAGVNCLAFKHNRVIKATPRTLGRAVAGAGPGTLVLLSPGRYSWLEIRNKKGSPAAPITICGPRTAVFDGSANKMKIMIQAEKCTYLILAGFTVQNALQGIHIRWTMRSIITGVRLNNIGNEALHVSRWSHYNTLSRNHITNTGRKFKGKGEGVYIGSNEDNVNRDRCTGNRIMYNIIGPGVTGELIDIKHYSVNGLIQGNILDGRDLCGCMFATSLINVKGNGYRIIGNVGKNSIEDMFKTSTTLPGQAMQNYFSGNKCVTGLRRGMYCVKVSTFGRSTAANKVACGQRTNTRCLGRK